MFARNARVTRGQVYVLFPTRGKVPKELFKGTPLENPRVVGKNPMIFTELNRKNAP